MLEIVCGKTMYNIQIGFTFKECMGTIEFVAAVPKSLKKGFCT